MKTFWAFFFCIQETPHRYQEFECLWSKIGLYSELGLELVTLFPHVNDNDISQLWAPVSSGIRKGVDSTGFWVLRCPPAMHEQQVEKMWSAGFMHHPS